jgi:lipid A disaccharide synthetase
VLLKIFIKIKYANIINIISNKEVIPEYIQSNFTARNISYALSKLISNPNETSLQVESAKKIRLFEFLRKNRFLKRLKIVKRFNLLF